MGIWGLFLRGVAWVLGLFFPATDERDVAHQAGLDQGMAQQKSADQGAILQEVQDAHDAAIAASQLNSSGVSNESDGFRRD